MPKLSIIAAMSENRVIGRDNSLPWNLPDDWKNFRRVTQGKAFLMGRKSYESEEALLSDHRNIIVTRQSALDLCSNCELANSIEAGLQLLERGKEEVFILGGAAIFEQTLHRANYLYLTIVHTRIEGDAYFPEVDWAQWTLVHSVRHEKDEEHAFPFSLKEFERAGW